MHLGYNDLVGQLRRALDQFAEVKLIAFSWVAGLIVAYILLIGPADYFLLKDVIRRMHVTWISFPAIALLFCGLAIAMQGQFKAHEVKLNQVDLVDVDPTANIVRGTTWVHVYSPQTEAYDVRLTSHWLDDETSTEQGNLLSWQGLPGTGLSGLDANSAALFNVPYTVERAAAASSLVDLPIQIDGTKTLVSRWWMEPNLSVETSLRVDKDGLLRGEVVNPLGVELSECLLLYDNWAYRLDRKGGILGPGDSTRIESEKALNLSWRLTRRRVVEVKDVATRWDQRDEDIPRLLEMLMFHKAAGGENYTQLQHRYQSYIDLSDHLVSGRAILLGQAKQPASAIELNGELMSDRYDQRWTFYRVVFPVELPVDSDSRR